MLPAPCYLLSDAHIGAAPADVEQSLVSFLRGLPPDAASLVINGDLFDFWFEWRHVVPRAGVRVLGELARIADRGIPLLWIAGNHDCWGGDVLRKDIGADYHVGPWRGQLGGWDTLVEHGDGLRDVEDRPYRRLRTVLRHPLSVRLFRWLHPDWATWVALRSSHTSRNMRPRDGGEGLKRVAQARLAAADAPRLMIFGHSHVTTLEQASGRVFANPGAWMDAPTFLRVTPGAVELCRWTGNTYTVERGLPASTPSGS